MTVADHFEQASPDVLAEGEAPATPEGGPTPAAASGADASTLAPAAVYQAPQARHGSRVPTPVWLVLLVAAAIAGGYVGHVLLREPLKVGELTARTTITEAQLDDVVATYRYRDEVHQVTAREAIAQASSLDAVRTAEGSYAMPSAESVLSAVRTSVLMREVEARGITVSDEELVAYASETFGTDDIVGLAATFTMDEQTVRDRLRESAAIAKLREEVVTPPQDAPAEPTAPKDGKLETASADYATYVIELAGDEWDAERGSWASYDGPYASALKDYDVRPDKATFAAAQTAYNVAYQLHTSSVTEANTQWTEFVNGLLCEVSLGLSSAVS